MVAKAFPSLCHMDAILYWELLLQKVVAAKNIVHHSPSVAEFQVQKRKHIKKCWFEKLDSMLGSFLRSASMGQDP